MGDSDGDTPLHAAASANGIEVLQFLLLCEGNPDTANHAGLTPCHVARSLKALELLSVAGAQVITYNEPNTENLDVLICECVGVLYR